MIKKKNIKLVILSVIILYVFIFSDIGIISRIHADKKIQNNKTRLEQLKDDKEILLMRMDKLKSKDYDYIAEHARKLGYARPGEKIYRFVKNIETTNNIKKTKIKQPSKIKFKIKDYLIYIITFLVVVIIYIILLLTTKRN